MRIERREKRRYLSGRLTFRCGLWRDGNGWNDLFHLLQLNERRGGFGQNSRHGVFDVERMPMSCVRGNGDETCSTETEHADSTRSIQIRRIPKFRSTMEDRLLNGQQIRIDRSARRQSGRQRCTGEIGDRCARMRLREKRERRRMRRMRRRTGRGRG